MSQVIMQYLSQSSVIDKRQTDCPNNSSVTGYGKKIATAWELKLTDNKWRRVYCVIFSNMGTNYVIVKGSRVYLESSFAF